MHRGSLETVTGRVTTGDSYCGEAGVGAIDLLKIDVEGWEYFVLKGFDALLKAQQVGVVQFEYGYTHADVHTLMRDFYQLFESHGMRVGRLTPKGVDFSPFSYDLNDFKSGPNFIACQARYVDKLSRF